MTEIGIASMRRVNKSDVSYSIRLSLIIQGLKCNPASISDMLSVQPTKTIGKEDLRLGSRRQPLWLLRSPEEPVGSSIEKQWAVLKEILVPRQAVLTKLPEDIDICFACAVFSSTRTPPIFFPREMIQFASSINASIDVDLYFRPVVTRGRRPPSKK